LHLFLPIHPTRQQDQGICFCNRLDICIHGKSRTNFTFWLGKQSAAARSLDLDDAGEASVGPSVPEAICGRSVSGQHSVPTWGHRCCSHHWAHCTNWRGVGQVLVARVMGAGICRLRIYA
jgi:hypothetical protein